VLEVLWLHKTKCSSAPLTELEPPGVHTCGCSPWGNLMGVVTLMKQHQRYPTFCIGKNYVGLHNSHLRFLAEYLINFTV